MDRKKEYTEWFQYADDDLSSAEVLYEQYRKSLNIICYHCQQSAEKYLKGFLVSKNVSFERTHDLLKIIRACSDVDPLFSSLTEGCLRLNPYSIITRYPSELELIESDAESAIDSAKKIKTFVNKRIDDFV